MKLGIRVNERSHTPLADQIAEKIRRLVKTGRLKGGLTLPSVRDLAAEVGVNFATVSRAYKMLQDECVIVLNKSRRLEVSANGMADEAERAQLLTPTILGLRAKARELQLSDSVLLKEIARVLQWSASASLPRPDAPTQDRQAAQHRH